MRKLGLVILMTFISLNILAQNDHYGSGNIWRSFNGEGWLYPGDNGRKGKETEAGVAPSAIKLNISALSAGNLGLQYERAVHPKVSFALGFRYTLPITAQSFITDPIQSGFEDGADTSVVLGVPKITGYAITPEIRWYPKNVMKGFYLSPYFRYRSNSLAIPFKYYDDFLNQQSLEINGNINSMIFGLGFGIHAQLFRVVSLDIYIAGIQFGTTTGSLGFTSSTPLFSNNDILEINKAFQDFKDFVPVNLNLEPIVTDRSIDVETRFAAPGIRAGGISLGFRF